MKRIYKVLVIVAFLTFLGFYLNKYKSLVLDYLFTHKEAKILFIGDSITQLAEWKLLLHRFDVKNIGIGGYTTLNMISEGNIQKIKDSNAETYFVMAGINDMVIKNYDLDFIKSNYEKLIDTILLEKPEKIILVSTLYQLENIHKQTIDQLNTFLKSKSDSNNLIEFLDLNKELSTNEHLNAQYTYDGIHLNDEGYAIWIKLIEDSHYLPE